MPTLYVVATPIGNLGDCSPRAIETLKAVALIAADDTRVTQRLLSAFDIHTPLTSCHEHNQREKAAQIVRRMLDEGMDVAVTTDAGTPCISDPGCELVRQAAEAGIPAVAVAGPSAMAATLSVSGFAVTEFTFYGFLPRQKAELADKLRDMARYSRLAIVHESPYRVMDLLACVAEVLPGTLVSASCDLTKLHELTLRGPVNEVLEALRANPKAEKGEYCLALEWHDAPPALAAPAPDISLEARLFELILQGRTLREATDELAAAGERKNAVKAAALRVKERLKDE